MRIAITQPCLAHYRIPVFRELASREGIELTVYYGTQAGHHNVNPGDAFISRFGQSRRIGFRRIGLTWDHAQVVAAHTRHTDVLVLPSDLHYLSLAPAILRAKQQGVSVILWGHHIGKRMRTWVETTRRNLLGCADAVLCYHDHCRDQLLAAGLAKERLFVARNSIDLEPITAARQSVEADSRGVAHLREVHGLSQGPVLLFVSRIKPRNRVDLLVRALLTVKRTHPHAKLVIVGAFSAEQQRVSRLASELGISNAVKFVGAIYDESSLAYWFAMADAFVYPEQIGLSIVHAFAYGIPVVSDDRDSGQNPEYYALQDGVNGVKYRRGSVDSLADAILKCIRPEVSIALRKGALNTAYRSFGVKRMVDGFVEASEFAMARKHKMCSRVS
jgi:glycosyltransferase involved in cell wall biosynthesis